MSQENSQLKEALKMLQRELLDIVQLKHDIYTQRFKAEFGQHKQPETEEQIAHQIQLIRDELFNTAFDENGKELVQKFKMNFQRLKEFMHTIDKEIGSMAVFNQRDDKAVYGGGDETTDKYSDITSVQQLRHLLRNYEALVEGQNHLLTQSITKMQKIPAPEEITATFNRFQVLKDSELDDFRRFLDDNKQILQQQYRDFENDKHSFGELTQRMEQEKLKVAQDREQIEAEVRRIREMNNQLQQQLSMGGRQLMTPV